MDMRLDLNGRHRARTAVYAAPCGTLERLPKWLICIPLACQWLGLALRYRSATLPSSANPFITSGGLVGEGKLEYFRGMGPVAKAATAPFVAITSDGKVSAIQLGKRLLAAGIPFPVVAKPDLGLCGYGVRKLANMAALLEYAAAFPLGETVVVQPYLEQEGEAGIFYARDPITGAGRIIGLALRYFPRVTGDGRHSISELMAADPRAQRMESVKHECCIDTATIPQAGQVIRLATIGSTRVGGIYRDGSRHITPALTAAIDAIARDMPSFHCGRFDVRFDSLRELGAGHRFVIMEINGAGSEAIQAWDPDIGLLHAFRIIFAKQRLLFAIGHAQRRKGAVPIGLLLLARLYRRQQRLIALYPPSN